MADSHLTSQEYWESTWAQPDGGDSPPRSAFKRFLFQQPSTRQLWQRILPSLMPAGPMRVIELGSAPGRHLLPWHAVFGYEIFGADFSETGLARQRSLFASHGISAEHSIQADFLNPDFHRAYQNAFDVVYSAGLIEHFAEPGEAIAAHLKLLKPGGHLVISIPNIVGIYRRLLPQSTVDAHNLEIMTMPKFRALFDHRELECRFCGYYGILNLGIAFDDRTALHRVLPKLQIMANLLTRVIPIPNNRWTSPELLFIGRKLA